MQQASECQHGSITPAFACFLLSLMDAIMLKKWSDPL
ncbi:hypothetical protein I656_03784 [Geobacillus sp. WSUCF1]|nr:hypothetical protein I656_03784 [Geobacillus sp. WSUCF1]